MPWIIFVDQFWSKEMIQHGLRNSLEDSSFTIPPPLLGYTREEGSLWGRMPN
jgi:hypothetical protein